MLLKMNKLFCYNKSQNSYNLKVCSARNLQNAMFLNNKGQKILHTKIKKQKGYTNPTAFPPEVNLCQLLFGTKRRRKYCTFVKWFHAYYSERHSQICGIWQETFQQNYATAPRQSHNMFNAFSLSLCLNNKTI